MSSALFGNGSIGSPHSLAHYRSESSRDFMAYHKLSGKSLNDTYQSPDDSGFQKIFEISEKFIHVRTFLSL